MSAWKDVSRPRDLVKYSDAIFLMTDTRESVWIPTVMDRGLGKTLVNAALGLDGWLVMQHGVYGCASNCLGCYFCSRR